MPKKGRKSRQTIKQKSERAITPQRVRAEQRQTNQQPPPGQRKSGQTITPKKSERAITPERRTEDRVVRLSSAVLTKNLTKKLSDITDQLLDINFELNNPKTSNSRRKRLIERKSQMTKGQSEIDSQLMGIEAKEKIKEAQQKIEELQMSYPAFELKVHREAIENYDRAQIAPMGINDMSPDGAAMRRRHAEQLRLFNIDPRTMNAGQRAEKALNRRTKLRTELRQGGFIAPVSNKKALFNLRTNTLALLRASNIAIAQEKIDRKAQKRAGNGGGGLFSTAASFASEWGWGG